MCSLSDAVDGEDPLAVGREGDPVDGRRGGRQRQGPRLRPVVRRVDVDAAGVAHRRVHPVGRDGEIAVIRSWQHRSPIGRRLAVEVPELDAAVVTAAEHRASAGQERDVVDVGVVGVARRCSGRGGVVVLLAARQRRDRSRRARADAAARPRDAARARARRPCPRRRPCRPSNRRCPRSTARAPRPARRRRSRRRAAGARAVAAATVPPRAASPASAAARPAVEPPVPPAPALPLVPATPPVPCCRRSSRPCPRYRWSRRRRRSPRCRWSEPPVPALPPVPAAPLTPPSQNLALLHRDGDRHRLARRADVREVGPEVTHAPGGRAHERVDLDGPRHTGGDGQVEHRRRH